MSDRRAWIAGGLIVAVGLGLTLAARLLPLADWADRLTERVAGLGVWGPLAFGAVYVLAVVLMIPASALTLAAGAVFGLTVGTITTSIASTLGAALAFLLARTVARKAVERRLARSPRFAALDRAIGRDGWKVVALLRLSPAVPFNVQNYAYGLTAIGFVPCVLTSWVAMLPGTLLYVYLGHAGRAGLEAAGGSADRGPLGWAWLGLGLLATLAVTVYLARIARRALRDGEGIGDDAGAGPPRG